jgi:hypothetical protein
VRCLRSIIYNTSRACSYRHGACALLFTILHVPAATGTVPALYYLQYFTCLQVQARCLRAIIYNTSRACSCRHGACALLFTILDVPAATGTVPALYYLQYLTCLQVQARCLRSIIYNTSRACSCRHGACALLFTILDVPAAAGTVPALYYLEYLNPPPPCDQTLFKIIKAWRHSLNRRRRREF